MADLIVVLGGYPVVEVGSHEALMARCGQYAELYGIRGRRLPLTNSLHPSIRAVKRSSPVPQSEGDTVTRSTSRRAG